jgi:hypothetical protein
METLGTARLTAGIPAERAVTTVMSRDEIAEALQDPEDSLELLLDVNRDEERSTIGIGWSRDDLEKLLGRTSGDDVLFTFDRNELEAAFYDVEAHGLRLRPKTLVFAVAAMGALSSGTTIANAAPTLADSGSPLAATVHAVTAAPSVPVAGMESNVHTPGLQLGAEGSAATTTFGTRVSASAVDSGMPSNARTPGLQIGDEGPAGTGAVVHASSVESSGGEFLGVPSRDVTDGLIAGGVLIAIAGATFAGRRRPGTPRPA